MNIKSEKKVPAEKSAEELRREAELEILVRASHDKATVEYACKEREARQQAENQAKVAKSRELYAAGVVVADELESAFAGAGMVRRYCKMTYDEVCEWEFPGNLSVSVSLVLGRTGGSKWSCGYLDGSFKLKLRINDKTQSYGRSATSALKVVSRISDYVAGVKAKIAEKRTTETSVAKAMRLVREEMAARFPGSVELESWYAKKPDGAIVTWHAEREYSKYTRDYSTSEIQVEIRLPAKIVHLTVAIDSATVTSVRGVTVPADPSLGSVLGSISLAHYGRRVCKNREVK